MKPSILGSILVVAFLFLTGWIVLDSMTCTSWHCQWLFFLPAIPWILALLPFASGLSPMINNSALMASIAVNVVLWYQIGARLERRIRH